MYPAFNSSLCSQPNDKHADSSHQTFLTTQIFLSFTPVAVFASFTAGVLLLSFICAFLFSLFWIGVALLVLVPTLFITVSLGIAVWIWAVCTFLIAKWVYDMIPVNVRGGAVVDMPNGKSVVLEKTGEGYGDVRGDIRQV